MRVRNHRDFRPGVMFLVIGAAFALFAQQYALGTPARMAPGFFPTMLGVLLALLRRRSCCTRSSTIDCWATRHGVDMAGRIEANRSNKAL